METKIIQSKQFNIAWRDVLRSCIFSAVASGLAALQQALDSGVFDWKYIGITAVSAFVGKLIINFVQQDKVVVVPGADTTLIQATNDIKKAI